MKTEQFHLICMQIALEEFTIAYDKLLYEESIALKKTNGPRSNAANSFGI